jgi:protein involved in polysaccharide export with SLBB domain
VVLGGCAAWTNPVANGIPVPLLPEELLAEPKEGKVTIPLNFLKRPPADVYRLAAGDVLGVYIEGVLGDRTLPPPVNITEFSNLPPSLGYPLPVREDGRLPLPLVGPLPVQGLTLTEAEQAIIRAYTVTTETIQPGRARIIVTLVRPRLTRVLVVRQDSPLTTTTTIRAPGRIRSTRVIRGGAEELVGGTRRGTGTVVDLPAYENDVLNALAQTGGLPGLDAANEVVIQRAPRRQGPIRAELVPPPGAVGPVVPLPMGHFDLQPLGMAGGEIIRIPLRIWPGEPLPFRPEDVLLYPGDIVFIEARDTEVFYTGGLLPSGEYALPRDYDLDVVEAIAQVGGPLVNGGINSNNLSGEIVSPGLGGPSPALVTVLRRDPSGQQVEIMVDLNRALRDPRESVLVRSGDVLILQESKQQALARYFSQVLNFSFFSDVIRTSRSTGTAAISVP